MHNTFYSYAKLNLGLKIVGKQNNGYHLLNTIFCIIDLYDKLEFEISHNGKINIVNDTQTWPIEDDLIFKATSLLKTISNRNNGVSIKVIKKIPIGSGMGGGSSNAATTLVVLNKLWNLNLKHEELFKMALLIGADVPFFILNKHAYAEGIGEILTPISLPELYFVIVKPDFSIKTKDIFDEIKEYSRNTINYKILLATKENDLMKYAILKYPILQQIVIELSKFGKVYMTGSGSALYLVFDNIESAKNVAKKLTSSYNIYLTKTLKI